ncbi:hypothetical protein [Burkholderia anthina]|nr:hypothetical protein [Burkholderia anthina]
MVWKGESDYEKNAGILVDDPADIGRDNGLEAARGRNAWKRIPDV